LSFQSLASRLFQLFVARTDIFGVEDEKGWVTKKDEQLTVDHVKRHLAGTIGCCNPNLCPKRTRQTSERGDKESTEEHLKYVHVQNM